MMEDRFGLSGDAPIIKQLIALISYDSFPIEIMGRDTDNNILLLMPDSSESEVEKRLEGLTRRVVAHTFVVGEEMVRLTPVIGYTALERTASAEALYDRTMAARTHAALQLDLQPVIYHPRMDALLQAVKAKTQTIKQSQPMDTTDTPLANGLPNRQHDYGGNGGAIWDICVFGQSRLGYKHVRICDRGGIASGNRGADLERKPAGTAAT